MKKLFIKTGLFLTLFAIMILSSCKKQIENNLSPKNNIESSLKSKLNVNVENGIIVFKNFGNYNSTIKKLSHLTDNERINWDNSLSGFISYDSACDMALAALDNATTMDEANNVVEKYGDLLAVSQSKGESYYDFIVEPNIFTNVANKDGVYIVGNCAYRMLGEYILRVDREKINELLSVQYADVKNNNIPPDIKVQTYTTSLQSENENMNYKTASASTLLNSTNNLITTSTDTWVPYCHDTTIQNQTTDRMVKLEVTAYWAPEVSGNNVTYGLSYYADITAWGLKRLWAWGWVRYNTQVNIEGTNLSGNDFAIETPWGIYQYDIPQFTSIGDVWGLTTPHPDYGFGPQSWSGSTGPEMYIISAYLKAWTRGTTENCCAVINYDRTSVSGGSGGGGGGGPQPLPEPL